MPGEQFPGGEGVIHPLSSHFGPKIYTQQRLSLRNKLAYICDVPTNVISAIGRLFSNNAYSNDHFNR